MLEAMSVPAPHRARWRRKTRCLAGSPSSTRGWPDRPPPAAPRCLQDDRCRHGERSCGRSLGQSDGEGSAFSEIARNGDRSLVRMDDSLAEPEADSEAPERLIGDGALEALEHARLVRG